MTGGERMETRDGGTEGSPLGNVINFRDFCVISRETIVNERRFRASLPREGEGGPLAVDEDVVRGSLFALYPVDSSFRLLFAKYGIYIKVSL